MLFSYTIEYLRYDGAVPKDVLEGVTETKILVINIIFASVFVLGVIAIVYRIKYFKRVVSNHKILSYDACYTLMF
jgi:hypothetical protein